MRKLLMVLIVLVMSGCVCTPPIRAEELSCDMKLGGLCESKISDVAQVFEQVMDYNNRLHSLIREDEDDFVPILFAQFKMESTAILLYSVMVELSHITEERKLHSMTFTLLDQYIGLLRDGMIKAKMFEGMLKDPNNWLNINLDRLILAKVAVNLKVAHDLLVQIKEELEGFQCE